jgi:iron complex transport system substrate-binding protein
MSNPHIAAATQPARWAWWLLGLALWPASVPAQTQSESQTQIQVHQSGPAEVIDDSGARLQLPQPARRIVSLAPHLTELLFSLELGERLVGVVEYSDYPPQARELPRVGGYQAADLERIIALQPDLVVAWQTGNHPGQLARLKAMGIPVFINEPRVLDDIGLTLQRLGVLTGRQETAQRLVNEFTAGLERLRQSRQHARPVRVFYQIWDRPLMTINGQHLISDVIRLCGGSNVFADLPALAPVVGIEAVLAAAPEVIVIGGLDTLHQNWLADWRRWPGLPAVARNQLYTVNPDHLQRHSLRILQGAERLCEVLDRASS